MKYLRANMVFYPVKFVRSGDRPTAKYIKESAIAAFHRASSNKGVDLSAMFNSARWTSHILVTFNNVPIRSDSELYGLLINRGITVKKDLESLQCMQHALSTASSLAITKSHLWLDLAFFMPAKLQKFGDFVSLLKDPQVDIERQLIEMGALTIRQPSYEPSPSFQDAAYRKDIFGRLNGPEFAGELGACERYNVRVMFDTVPIGQPKTLIDEISKMPTDITDATVDNIYALLAFAIRTRKNNMQRKKSIIVDLRRIMPDIMYSLGIKEEGYAGHLNSDLKLETLTSLCKDRLIEIGDKNGQVQEPLAGLQEPPRIKPPHQSHNLRFLI